DRDTFLQELSQLDLKGLKDHCEGAVRAANSPSANLDQYIQPVPPESIGSVRKSDKSCLTEWENEGLLQISQSQVGVLLLAGGQGTRLGVQYPKGMYNVGLPSGKTLYQIQAERIHKSRSCPTESMAANATASMVRPFSITADTRYIMTSEFTLAPTEKFFKENNFFGLDPSNIIMFEQRMIPAVTFDGKVILQNKGKIAMAPDGNGGLYQALVDNKVLEDMKKRGVEYLHVYCVDNILVKMADPVFIGFCVSRGADCGAKVVEKAYPAEPVGVVCKVQGVSQVVEYSELQPETAELRGPGGELVYSAGNICNHLFTRAFLQDVAEKFKDQLKQHVALKKVPFVDSCGNHVKPTKPNGIKMEKFVFDVFPFSSASAEDNPPAQCEISPLVSYFGEGLEKLLGGRTLPTPFILGEKRAKELQAQ
ncbi:UDP-N-acetylhexosamine pyrophosphorylase-like protein 1, partial [Nibea albiflora]